MAKLRIESDGVKKVLDDAKEIEMQLEKIKKIAKEGKIELSDKEAIAVLKNLQNEADKSSKSLNNIDKSLKFSNFKAAAKTISSELVNIAAVAATSGKSTSENINSIGGSIAGIASQFGFVGSAVGALITVVTPAIASLFEVSESEKAIAAATDNATKAIGAEQVILENSFATLRSATTNYSERKDAIGELQKLLPGYFDDLSIEERDVTKLNTAYEIANVLIRERSIRIAFNSQKQEQFNKLAAAELKLQQEKQRIEEETIYGSKYRDLQTKEAQEDYNTVLQETNKTLDDIEKAENSAVDAINNRLTAEQKAALQAAKTTKSNKEQSEDRKKDAQAATKIADDKAKKQKDIDDKAKKDAEDKKKAEEKALEELKALEAAKLKELQDAIKKSNQTSEANRKQNLTENRDYLNALSEQTLFKLSQEDEALKKQLDDAIKLRKESGKEQDQNELDLISSITAQRLKILENSYNEELKILERAYKQKVFDGTATKADTVKFETDKLAIKAKYQKDAEAIDNDGASRREKAREVEKQQIIQNVANIAKELQGLGNLVFDIVQQNSQNILDGLEEDLSLVESKSSEAISRISELESELEGERGGRRDAILQSLEQQRNIEEELAQQKIDLALRIEKENAKIRKREQAAAIANAIINGALAITNIFATVPKVDFGVSTFILAGISAATTAAQVALIASQKFAKGGFTGAGSNIDETGHKVAGIVHNDEWVAPKWLVESPKFGGVIQQLETVRQRGFADGGYTSANFENVSNALTVDKTSQMLSAKLDNFMNMSLALANRPIVANPIEFSNVENTVARRIYASTIGG
jgi:hypothetical protein